jgi:putative spermidine/putrescine transport system ATP-binding protein
MSRSQPAIVLRGVSKHFGEVRAVDEVDLEVADGEFFSMLGPSGSGKTTVLRLIAGFERVTAGTVELAGTNVTDLAPFDRDVNTVFQDYALFPHMTVMDNIGYGLRVRGVNAADRGHRVKEALDTVRLGNLATRKPHQLSGGQRQRVALARAIVVRPKVLLLDEPLGALDLQLREQMQVELKALQRDLGITFVFVTHDQEEALTLSDRVAVFREGKIVQLGTPREIYEEPRTEYVASFVGTSNIFGEEVSNRLLGRGGAHALRPEKVALSSPDAAPVGDAGFRLAGEVEESIYLGTGHRIHLRLDDGTPLIALQPSIEGAARERGDRVVASWTAADLVELT